MAFITKFEKDEERSFKSVHPTEVVARYLVAERDGKTILQLNTYGSVTREMPGKLSQTLQLDQKSAEELVNILKAEFKLR